MLEWIETGLFARCISNSKTDLPLEPNWFASRAELVCKPGSGLEDRAQIRGVPTQGILTV